MTTGEVVRSLRGKDGGQLLAVVRQDENGVWLADGKRRPLCRPKRKNPRHLAATGLALQPTSMTTNRALRRALKALCQAAAHDERPEGG